MDTPEQAQKESSSSDIPKESIPEPDFDPVMAFIETLTDEDHIYAKQLLHGVKLDAEACATWGKHIKWRIWEAAVLLCGFDPEKSQIEKRVEEFIRDNGDEYPQIPPISAIIAHTAPRGLKHFNEVYETLIRNLPDIKEPQGHEMVPVKQIQNCANTYNLGSSNLRDRLFAASLAAPPEPESTSDTLLPSERKPVNGDDDKKYLIQARVAEKLAQTKSISLGTAKTRVYRAVEDGKLRDQPEKGGIELGEALIWLEGQSGPNGRGQKRNKKKQNTSPYDEHFYLS